MCGLKGWKVDVVLPELQQHHPPFRDAQSPALHLQPRTVRRFDENFVSVFDGVSSSLSDACLLCVPRRPDHVPGAPPPVARRPTQVPERSRQLHRSPQVYDRLDVEEQRVVA